MRKLLTALLLALFLSFGPMLSSASACPMCAKANETEDNRPKAYMYSILFMMSMPAILFTGFGVGIYRMSQKNAADAPTEENDAMS